MLLIRVYKNPSRPYEKASRFMAGKKLPRKRKRNNDQVLHVPSNVISDGKMVSQPS